MTIRSTASRAAMCLGAAAIASVLFALAKRELHFIALPTPAIVATLVLGAVAIAAGWLASRALTLVAATGFLAAAIAQVATQTAGASIANGTNGSTAGLWLGLGAGLLAAGLTRYPQHQEMTPVCENGSGRRAGGPPGRAMAHRLAAAALTEASVPG